MTGLAVVRPLPKPDVQPVLTRRRASACVRALGREEDLARLLDAALCTVLDG
jgi:hypothetical protein